MIQPMLAQTAAAPFDRSDWLFEQKLDGVRCIAYLAVETRLQGRNGTDITRNFPELHGLHRQVRQPCILDGEIICASFEQVQKRIHKEKALDIRVASRLYPATYAAFDILNVSGDSTAHLTLLARKALLAEVLTSEERGKALPWQLGDGIALFHQVAAGHGEGIMAKWSLSPYVEGRRSEYWLKIKNFQEGVFYVCGVTEGEGARGDTFGSLILGELVGDRMVYVGNAGSGLDDSELKHLLAVLSLLKGDSPFTRADIDRPVKFWTKPAIKVEVRYLERGSDGKLRFPTFRKLSNR